MLVKELTQRVQPRFMAMPAKPQKIAHRGAQIENDSPQRAGLSPIINVYVENTVEAMVRAAQLGAEAVELDVISAKDQTGNEGELFVFHDDMTGRPFRLPSGDKLLKEATNAEVRAAVLDEVGLQKTIQPKLEGYPNVGIQYKTDRAKIPTLKEVLDAVLAVKPDMHFYIEVKTTKDPVHPSWTNHAEEKLVKLIQERNLYDNVTVISFNPQSLLKVKTLDPKIKTGLDIVLAEYLPHNTLEGIVDWAKNFLKVDALIPPYKEMTKAVVDACKPVGLKIAPWVWHETRQEEIEMFPKLTEMGVDGIITNNTDALVDFQNHGTAKPSPSP